MGLTLLLLLSLAGYFGSLSRHAELASHFKLQYLMGASLCLLVLLLGKSWRWASVAILVVLLNGWEVGQWSLPNQAHPISADQPRLRLLICNLWAGNTKHQKLLNFIETHNIDIAIFQETTYKWTAALEPLKEKLPYFKIVPRSDYFGIGVFSKYPIDDLHVERYGQSQIPSLVGQLQWNDQTIHLVAIHPVPPVSAEYAQRRNAHLKELATLLQNTTGPIIVAGDFNASMWSPIYREFETTAKLHNARLSYGVQPSWPTRFGTKWLMIPIDHCLCSDHFVVTKYQTGPDIGSDHLPLIVDLALKSNPHDVAYKK